MLVFFKFASAIYLTSNKNPNSNKLAYNKPLIQQRILLKTSLLIKKRFNIKNHKIFNTKTNLNFILIDFEIKNFIQNTYKQMINNTIMAFIKIENYIKNLEETRYEMLQFYSVFKKHNITTVYNKFKDILLKIIEKMEREPFFDKKILSDIKVNFIDILSVNQIVFCSSNILKDVKDGLTNYGRNSSKKIMNESFFFEFSYLNSRVDSNHIRKETRTFQNFWIKFKNELLFKFESDINDKDKKLFRRLEVFFNEMLWDYLKLLILNLDK